LWMTGADDMETLYDMITVNGAKAMNVKNYGIKEGNPASFLALGVPSVLEAFRAQEAPAYVVNGGKVIAETKSVTKIYKK